MDHRAAPHPDERAGLSELSQLSELRAELAELRLRHDALLARVSAAERTATGGSCAGGSGDTSEPRRVGRRLVLAGAAAAAAGAAVAAASGARPAAAQGAPMESAARNAVQRQTALVHDPTEPEGPVVAGGDLDVVDVLLSLDNTIATTTRGTALEALGRTRAIAAATTAGGTAVEIRASASADGAASTGLSAIAEGNGGIGVVASGPAYGIRAGGGATAGDFVGNNYGVTLNAPRPLVFTGGHGSVGPPITPGNLGEVAFDLEGSLYLCVRAGLPAEWRRIAGPATAGALHLLIEPRRVYDSRAGYAPLGPSNGGPKGLMLDNEVRVIDAKANGAPVPPDATGLLFNLAVTSTNPAGFITAWGSGTRPLASSMNWSQADLTLSNSVTIGAGERATFSLYCGGGGSAHVIVDLAGYYR